MNENGLQWVYTAINMRTNKVEAIGTYQQVLHYVDFESNNDDDYLIDGHMMQVIRK